MHIHYPCPLLRDRSYDDKQGYISQAKMTPAVVKGGMFGCILDLAGQLFPVDKPLWGENAD